MLLIRSRIAALVLALGLAVAAPAADTPAKPPTADQIAGWVKGLASDAFEERENASRELWKAGKAAEAALRGLLKSGDAEAVRRAREILDKFDWGLYPDTPEAVTKLIEEYRSGSDENRMAAIPKLLDQGAAGYAALMKLAGLEKDAPAKALILQLLAADMPRLAAALLAAGQEARLEEILEQGLGSDGDSPHANYAAYLLVRGKLDDKLRTLQKKAGAAPDKKTALTLAYLCRARGDLAGARGYAAKAENPELLTTILVEQEDWKALLKHLDTAPAPEGGSGAGLRAACLRLAGDRDGLNAELTKLGLSPKEMSPVLALLLNGRPDQALTWLMKNQEFESAADLLGARHRFREALDAADKAPAEDTVGALKARLYKATLLARLGERKPARELFDKLAAEANTEPGAGILASLMVAEYGAGFRDEAFARALALQAKAEEKDNFTIINLLFRASDLEIDVEPWWKFLRRKFPKDDAAATVGRLRDLFGRKTQARATTTTLLKEMADEAANLKDEEREPWLHCVVNSCRALSRDDLLEGYLEKWAAHGGDTLALLQLGDLRAENKRWREAAEHYKRAREKNRSNPIPLYLYGWALTQAGQEKEGRRWTEMAELLPLGNELTRLELAEGLSKRGLDEAAGKEWERLSRFMLLTSPYAPLAAQALADKAVRARDYLKAATSYRREALHYLGRSDFEDVDYPLWLLNAERRMRSRGLAAAGRLDEMRQEVKAVLDVEPSIDLAIDVVTELTRGGHKKDADELFAKVYTAHDALCKEHPNSAWSHNNTAWLAVRCKRDLDAALEHARKGVELEPDNSGHLDTLAEVHFQRGDKDKAAELMKKCVAMQPQSAYFRNQLKRMRAGDPNAELPREPSPGTSYRSAVAAP